MREPGLQKTTALSLALHLTAFLIAFLFLKQSNHIIISPTYTVSLISSDILTGIDKGKNIDAPDTSKESVTQADIPKKNIKEISKGKEMVEEKISAIAAKKKKIDTLAKLHEIISIKASGGKHSIAAKTTSSTQGKANTSDDYYSKITNEIHDQWNCPPQICKNDLKAVISIRILKDGTAIAKLENSSGNILFDKLARRAIGKASPLTPPPYEMEIDVGFRP
jgi:outer membrane biosynthesis protein TonB